MYNKINLENKLRIVTYPMEGLRSVSVGIWIGVGGRFENASNKGISHFLEHLVFKGSRKYSCEEIKQGIEGSGGALNGFTSEEFTCYLVKVLDKNILKAIDILADMVVNPLIPSVEVEKERGVIIEEIKMYKDLPQHYVHELLDGLLWPNHPLGMNLAGTVDSVSGISREDLFKFQSFWYPVSNIVVVICGAFHEAKTIEKIKATFRKLASGKKTQFLKFSAKQNSPRFTTLNKKTEQTHLAMGYPSLKRDHPKKYVLSLLNTILGANMSSRLFKEIREKRGLAYEIGTSLKRHADSGAFVVHAGIDNRNVIQTIDLILKEFDKIKKFLPTKSEFMRAKEFYCGQLIIALEDPLNQMLMLGEDVLSKDEIHSPQETLKEIEKIKIEEISELAKDIFDPRHINVALIGPDSGIESKFKKII
ncbi:MAG: pitrilysin family protein [Candidatus Omnitrophota bacterium]